MKIDGECHCGKIAYQAEVDPDTLVICYCTDCQILAGSAYRAVVPASAKSFVMLRGEPKIYIKTSERGTKIAQSFCGDCISTPELHSDEAIETLRDSACGPSPSAVRPTSQRWAQRPTRFTSVPV